MPQAQVKQEVQDVPMLDCRAAIVPASLNEDQRTVDFIASTGARGLRRHWNGNYYEELEVSEKAVRLGRMNNGAPFLDTHSSWDASSVLGVIERAWIENGHLLVTVRFSQRDAVEPIFQDIKDGILRHVSIGYMVHEYAVTEKEGELDVHRGVDWEPMELSIVPMGFDDDAVSRNADTKTSQAKIIRASGLSTEGGAVMPTAKKQDQTQEPEKKAPDSENRGLSAEEATRIAGEAAKRATESERERVSEIQSAVRAAKMDADFADEMIRAGDTVDQARAKIIAKWEEQDDSEETRGIRTGVDTGIVTSVRDGVANAILNRANPVEDLTDDGRNFAGMSLSRICEDLLIRQGVSVRGLYPGEIASRALGTSDLAIITGSVMNRTLAMGYESGQRTFVGLFRQGTASDFREMSRVRLSGAPGLLEIKEAGEYKAGDLSDEKESYALVTYGRKLVLTREAIINDDLDALTRIPMAFGRAAADLESDIVWGIITDNAALQDGTTLFHADHDNLAGSGGAITATTVGAGRAAMRQQTGMEGRLINVLPRYLVAGADTETTIDQFLSVIAANQTSSVVPSSMRSLTPVIEPRLTGNQWYLFADHNQIDTIEYSYLQGNQGVYLETQHGFNTDGVEVKARHDFAAKAIDYRGAYKNPGAA